MIHCWRIVPTHRASTAMTGEGARRYGGRWNSVGHRMVYAAESRALAALEIMVHLPMAGRSQEFQRVSISFADELLEEISLASLPGDWNNPVVSASTQQRGDAWIRHGRCPVLRVPSVIIPEEANFLINPVHRKFGELAIGAMGPFSLDPRIL